MGSLEMSQCSMVSIQWSLRFEIIWVSNGHRPSEIDHRPLIAIEEVREMANQVGKRYVCKKCGAEFIVTKGGNGTLHCCGQPMELKK